MRSFAPVLLVVVPCGCLDAIVFAFSQGARGMTLLKRVSLWGFTSGPYLFPEDIGASPLRVLPPYPALKVEGGVWLVYFSY